jgi:hypothetical protein
MVISGLSRWTESEPFILDRFFRQTYQIPHEILSEKDYFYAVSHLSRALVALRLDRIDIAQAQMDRALHRHLSWLSFGSEDFGSEDFADRIIAAARSLQDAERVRFLQRAATLLPVATQTQREMASAWKSRLAISDAVAAYTNHEFGSARAAVLHAIRQDRSWLRKPWVASMLVKSCLGHRACGIILRTRRMMTRKNSIVESHLPRRPRRSNQSTA